MSVVDRALKLKTAANRTLALPPALILPQSVRQLIADLVDLLVDMAHDIESQQRKGK
jgi:hypothetical protein